MLDSLYDYPLELFEDSHRRKTLVNILSDKKNKSRQEELFEFNESRESLDIILDDIFSLIRNKKSLYQRWVKKDGDKERKLSVPKKPLRNFIENYILDFIKRNDVHEKCHGGEVGWSVKRSLETLLPCESALSFDLEKAFENIPIESVFNFFYELFEDNLSYEEKESIARFLSMLCTVKYSNKRGLPQGSPCSMALFNRILVPLDEVLYQKSKERGFRYIRWVDDISITSPNKVGIENFLGAVELTEKYSSIAKEKTFFQEGDKIYLLGYKICDTKILEKNTKEEKLRNKSPSINFHEWFGENKIKNYKPWID